MFKELKESMKTMSHQIKNINKKIKIIFKMKILELKQTINAI